MFADFIVPVSLGNVIGKTALLAVLSHAQVMKELQCVRIAAPIDYACLEMAGARRCKVAINWSNAS